MRKEVSYLFLLILREDTMPPLTGAALTGWSTPEAVLLILIGLIFAAAGWTVFGLSVVLAGALAGTYLGMLAAEKFQIDFRIAVVAGALVCGLAAVLLKRVAIFFVAGICGAGFSWWGFAALYPAASETLRLVVTAVVFTASGTLAAFLLRPVIIIATAFGGGASVALGAMSLAERYAPLSLAGRWGTVSIIGVSAFLAASLFGIVAQLVWGKGHKMPLEVDDGPTTTRRFKS